CNSHYVSHFAAFFIVARAKTFVVENSTVITVGMWISGNDPSAGSPTETLLRLLLPLDDKVWVTSRRINAESATLRHDGRCVQRAGT
ncbi:hypothetical protein T492DRAFT_603742, partial [Pavlovales sp. CCMP2436]